MDDAAAHFAVCAKASVGCVWGCPLQLERAQLTEHKASCPEVFIPCPGCSEPTKRRWGDAHWAACAQLPVICNFCDLMCMRGELQATHSPPTRTAAPRTTTYALPRYTHYPTYALQRHAPPPTHCSATHHRLRTAAPHTTAYALPRYTPTHCCATHTT